MVTHLYRNIENKKKHHRRSGGIGIFFKENVFKYTKIIETDSEYVQLFKIYKSSFSTGEDVMFGSVYIPPDNSPYFAIDLYETFKSEVERMLSSNRYAILLGDFNARTRNLSEILDLDDFIFNSINVNTSDMAQSTVTDILCKNNMLVHRQSCDTVTNRIGNHLVDMCKNNGLVILNGRAFDDKKGCCTCKNSSVVDYLIASKECIGLFSEFNIDDFLLSLFRRAQCP